MRNPMKKTVKKKGLNEFELLLSVVKNLTYKPSMMLASEKTALYDSLKKSVDQDYSKNSLNSEYDREILKFLNSLKKINSNSNRTQDLKNLISQEYHINTDMNSSFRKMIKDLELEEIFDGR